MKLRIMYVLVIYLLIFMPSRLCIAHNGQKVSVSKREQSLYYRICALHAIPIYYYIDQRFFTFSIQLNGRAYPRFGTELAQDALDRWSEVTTVPGQPPTCLFHQVYQRDQADLIFEAISMDFPPQAVLDPNMDSYITPSPTGGTQTIITIIPNRMSNILQQARTNFSQTPDEQYIDNYVFSRLLHLTGQAIGLDHPWPEVSDDIIIDSEIQNPDLGRSIFQASDLTQAELTRPHIMSSNTIAYLLDLQDYLGRSVFREDIRTAEAENQAIRYYLIHDWQCMWPSAYSARMDFSWSSSQPRCFIHPPLFGLLSVFNLLFQ